MDFPQKIKTEPLYDPAILSGYVYSKAISSVRGAETIRADEVPETTV